MKTIFFITIISLITISTKTKACDCVYNKLEKDVLSGSTILTGKFIEGKKLWELSELGHSKPLFYYTGKFVVSKVLKANGIKINDTLIISSDFSDCAMLYKSNTNYLLFATFFDGVLHSDICSYTGILDDNTTKKNYKQTKRILRKPTALTDISRKEKTTYHSS